MNKSVNKVNYYKYLSETHQKKTGYTEAVGKALQAGTG